MDYKDRQKQASITLADKKKYNIDYTNEFNTTFNHFLQAKESIGKTKSTVVNDNGVSLRKIPPITITFFGNNHDIEATKFEASAAYTGECYLQMPYGNEIRCHVNTVAKKYSVVNDISATIITIDFVECTGKTTPIGGRSQLASILEKSDEVNNAGASTFAGLKINNQKELTGITTAFNEAVDNVQAFLRPLIEGEADAIAIFDATYTSIKGNIDDLVDDATTLARQTATLIALPAKTSTKVSDVISIYKLMIDSVTPTHASLEKNNDGRNQSINAAFFGGVGVSAITTNIITNEFETTSKALKSVEDIQEVYNNYRDSIDDIQESFNDAPSLADRYIQDGTLSVPLNDLIQDTSGNVLSTALDLKKELRIILAEQTTALNIAIKYYPDDFINDEAKTTQFVISSNNLCCDELILIPTGREIVVYV